MWPLPPRGDSTAFPSPPDLQLLLTPPHSLPRMPCRTGSHLYSRTQAVPTGTPARDSKVKQHGLVPISPQQGPWICPGSHQAWQGPDSSLFQPRHLLEDPLSSSPALFHLLKV